jgi:hypothetical protein
MQVTDTLRAKQGFRQAGFSEEQAESLARQQEETAETLVSNIREALRPELDSMRSEFRVEFARLEARIESVSRDQLFKIIAIVLSSAALTIGALSLVLGAMR